MYFLLNLNHYVKSYGHLSHILAFFMMPALQIWPCHVTQEENFQTILLFPNFAFNIGKSCKISSRKLSTSEIISQKPHGGWKKAPVLLGLRQFMQIYLEDFYAQTVLPEPVWLIMKTKCI